MAVETIGDRFQGTLAAPPTTPMSDEHRQRLFDAIGAPPDNIAQLLESSRQQLAAIEADSRYTREAKNEMRRQVHDSTRQQFDALHTEYQAAELRKLAQSEGEARAALRDDPPALLMGATDFERTKIRVHQQHEANTLKRIDLDLRELDAATDLDDIAEQFEEAIEVGGAVTRRVCGYALRRGERIVATARAAGGGPAADSAAGRRLADMRTRFAEWKKANPTPSQRLRQAIERRAEREQTLTRQRERWLTAYAL